MGWLDGSPYDSSGQLSPQWAGILGALSALGQSPGIAPQPASRLPLARPNLLSTLGASAGGYLQGRQQAAQTGYLGAETAGKNLATADALWQYNLIAPKVGVKPLTMSDLQSGNFDKPTMAAAQTAAAQNASPVPADQNPIAKLFSGILGGNTQPQPAPAAPMPAQAQGQPATPQPAMQMAQAQPQTMTNPAPQGAPPAAPGGILSGAPTPASSGLPDWMPDMLINRKFGVNLTPVQSAAVASGMSPYDPSLRPLLQNEAVKASGVNPVIGGERPGVLPQYYNPKTGKYEADTSQLGQIEAGQYAAARGRSMGELGAKEAGDAFKAGLDINVANETAKRQEFYKTGVKPPDYGAAPGVSPPAGNSGATPGTPVVSPRGEVATPRGTIVPPPPKAIPFQGTDAITRQNANTEKTEENFGALRPGLEGTESRMVALGRALQIVQSGGLNEHKAEIANNLRAVPGLGPLADIVMSSKDTAAVQTAIGLQVQDVLGQLKQFNQGSGGRILNSEFQQMLNRQYGPDLSPQANYDLITQALGGIYQTENLIDDYHQFGKPMGWRDANGFMSAWFNQPQNKMPTMIDHAKDALGPLKGMQGSYQTGMPTATNPKTGERVYFDGKAWQPLK